MAVNVAEHALRVTDILGHSGQVLIGGERAGGSSGEMLETRDPGTGQALAHVQLGSAADIDAAASAAAAALDGWKRTAPLERATVLWQITDRHEDYADELAVLETLDTGKPLGHPAGDDLPSATNELRLMSGLAADVNGQVAPRASMQGDLSSTHTRGRSRSAPSERSSR